MTLARRGGIPSVEGQRSRAKVNIKGQVAPPPWWIGRELLAPLWICRVLVAPLTDKSRTITVQMCAS